MMLIIYFTYDYTIGKTSCIRCLTRTVVYIKHMQQYGKLIGRYDAHKYEIELIPRNHTEAEANDSDNDNDSELHPSSHIHNSLPPTTPPDASWKSPKNSTPRSKAKKASKEANIPKVVYCTLDELEMRSEDSCLPQGQDQEQGQEQAESVPLPGRPTKPKSTVGIDIDTWRPFVTHDFITQYQEAERRRNEPPQDIQENIPDLADLNNDGLLSETINTESIDCSSGYYKNLEILGSDDDEEEEEDGSNCLLIDQSAPSSSGNSRKKHKARSSQQSGAGAGAGGKGRKSKQTGKGSPRPPPAPAQDLVLSIWDFAGQEIYHAAQEAFFSERALYLVVWDMTKNTEKEMDKYVQFWIDLIQSRAPGSTIIVVATHADELIKQSKRKYNKPWGGAKRSSSSSRHSGNKSSPVTELESHDHLRWHTKPLCAILLKHLKCREESRKQSIEKDLCEAVKNGDVEQVAQLGYLSKNRPLICPVFPVSCTTMRGFSSLTAKIISLSKPTKKNRNPFQLVDVYIPRFYLKVKEEIENMRRGENHIVTMAELKDHISQTDNNAASFEDDSLTQKVSHHSVNDVRDAISFLSSIGEVVWFQPLSADGSHNQKSDLKSDFDKKSDTDMFSESSDATEMLPNTIPQMGTRGSTGSGGTATSNSCEGDAGMMQGDVNNSYWREVEELEAHLNYHGDISDMVFLSPHWLIDVLKRVLTHHLIETVRNLTTSMSQNDLSRYFGENHLEHAKNGIVRWSLIEEKLMHIQINSPIGTDTEIGREKRANVLKKNIIHSLR